MSTCFFFRFSFNFYLLKETTSLNNSKIKKNQINNFLDMPIIHFKKLIKLFKQIKYLTTYNLNDYVNLENKINGKCFIF